MPVLKQEYNHLLDRWHKGFKYLNNNSIPLAEREKWLPEYEKIGKRLNEILYKLKKQGMNPTSEQVLGGL